MRITWDKVRKNAILLSLLLVALCVMAIMLGVLGALVYFKEYVIWFILIGLGIGCYRWGYKDGELDGLGKYRGLENTYLSFKEYRKSKFKRDVTQEEKDLNQLEEDINNDIESEIIVELMAIKNSILEIRNDDQVDYIKYLENKINSVN